MIISSSSLGMESARFYTSVSKDAFHSEIGALTSFKKPISNEDNKSESTDKSSLQKSKSKNDFDNIFNQMKSFASSSAYDDKLERDAINRIRTQCIQYLLCVLFGRKASDELPISEVDNSSTNAVYATVTEHRSHSFYEAEETTFSTKGSVVTASGDTIPINLELSMSRAFSNYYESTVTKTTVFTDPLVINLNSNIAEVSDVKIKFDLDHDGELDEISTLSGNSGYLSLDHNNDGIINDGSELFGTSSGDGFKDLSAYDSDSNGWIDEADDIFDKLRICIMNEDGSQTLYKLKDKNVGAIYLGNVNTEFSLNNMSTNATNAVIRKTGIFLYESGEVGSMQHLDLAR